MEVNLVNSGQLLKKDDIWKHENKMYVNMELYFRLFITHTNINTKKQKSNCGIILPVVRLRNTLSTVIQINVKSSHIDI